jgi:aryl-alcohol dehydrogenase-like predicted oxidoreductase
MRDEAAETIVLGSTGLRVSAVGVGTNSWGARGESDPGKRQTFEDLLTDGVTLFDTAEIYTRGSSEATIGRCIHESGRTPTILTKFFPFPWRWTKQAMRAALQRSLARLQVPTVDVYLLHFPFPPVSVETWADALAHVVVAGFTRAVGISNCGPAPDPARARRPGGPRCPPCVQRGGVQPAETRAGKLGPRWRLPGARRHPGRL